MKQNKYALESLNILAQNIIKARQDLHISQEALAELCGVDRTYISLLERSKRNPSFLSMKKICKGLNITLSELLSGT